MTRTVVPTPKGIYPARDFRALLLYNRKRREGMTMLDLSPEIENTVRDYAAREGVSIDTLLERAFPPRQQPQPDAKARKLIEAIRQWQAEDVTDDEEELERRDQTRAQLQADLDLPRWQSGMRPLFTGPRRK